jgi:hypothetical protein
MKAWTKSLIFGLFLFSIILTGNASALTNIDSCQTLSTENETYVMNASITGSNNPCILFSKNNTILDCNGFYINETNAVSAISINSPLHDVTIKNCNIYAMNCSGSQFNPSQGITTNSYQTNLLVDNNTMNICGLGITHGVGGNNNTITNNNMYLYNWTTVSTTVGYVTLRNISNLNYSNNYLNIHTLSNGTTAGNAFEAGAFRENATFLNNRMDWFGTFNRGFHMGLVAPTPTSKNYYVDNLTIMCQNCSANGVFAPNNISGAIIKNINIITDRGHGIVLASIYASNISMENITVYGNLRLNTGLTITATASGVYNISIVNATISGFASGIATTGNYITIDSSKILNFSGSGISVSSNNTAITNSQIYNSTGTGIQSVAIIFNQTFTNLSVYNNYINLSNIIYPQDIIIQPVDQNQCNSIYINNVNTTGGIPYLFYNYSVNLSNWKDNFSDIILCNADNSVLSNLTTNAIYGSIFYVFHSDNVTMMNISRETPNGNYFNVCNNAYLENIFSNNSLSTNVGTVVSALTSNMTAKKIFSFNSLRLFVCQTNSTCNLSDSYAYNTNPLNVSATATIRISANSRATISNVTSNVSVLGIELLSASVGMPIEVNISNFYSFGARNVSIDMDSRYTNVTANIYNSILDSKITERCSNMITNNCSMKNTLNLYNTTVLDGYNVSTNSTMNVYWNLTVLNPQSANVIINDTNNVAVASFNDSESFWLLQFNVSSGNVTTYRSPYALQASKETFMTSTNIINLISNIVFGINMLKPPIIDPSSITGNLILTLGFGIIGIIAILTLLGFTYITSEGKPDTDAFIKIFIAVVIIVIMIVGVWQGIVLPP